MKKAKSNIAVGKLMQLPFYVLCVSASLAQVKTTKNFFKQDEELEVCSKRYILDSIGDFFALSSCENRMTVSLGFYQLQGDTVKFHFKPIKDFDPVLKKEESPAENDSLVKITVLSCLGNPVPPSFKIDAIEINGQFLKSLTVNEKGEVLFNPKKYKYLRLTTLNHFYPGWTYIDIKNKDQKIYLHFPERFFLLNHPHIWLFNDFSALLKPDGLYDLQGTNNLFPAQ